MKFGIFTSIKLVTETNQENYKVLGQEYQAICHINSSHLYSTLQKAKFTYIIFLRNKSKNRISITNDRKNRLQLQK